MKFNGKRVALCVDNDIFGSPIIEDETHGHPTQTSSIWKRLQHIRRKEILSTQCTLFWNGSENGCPRSFEVLLEVYANRMVATLKSNALIDYHVRSVLLKFTAYQRRYLIDNCFTLVGFRPMEKGYFIANHDYEEGWQLTKYIDVDQVATLPLN